MWAVLGLNIFAVIFWLSTMATLAAFRAQFTIPVDYSYPYGKRYFLVAGLGYLDIIVGDAVVSAIEVYIYLNYCSSSGISMLNKIFAGFFSSPAWQPLVPSSIVTA